MSTGVNVPGMIDPLEFFEGRLSHLGRGFEEELHHVLGVVVEVCRQRGAPDVLALQDGFGQSCGCLGTGSDSSMEKQEAPSAFRGKIRSA